MKEILLNPSPSSLKKKKKNPNAIPLLSVNLTSRQSVECLNKGLKVGTRVGWALTRTRVTGPMYLFLQQNRWAQLCSFLYHSWILDKSNPGPHYMIKSSLEPQSLSISILLFKGLPLFGFLIFQFKNAPTPLCVSRDKTKGYSGKNTTLTPTKTLPKKQDYSPVIFQITLSTYKLDSFFKK